MNLIPKLRPLAQLLPAAAVAAAVFLTLPTTEPVLAAVPERLTPPAASEPEAESQPAEEEETLPKLPYADGVYTGSSRGYGGQVKVQVTMADGEITDLQLLDASHETAAFLKRAKRLLPTVLEEQTWEVDAISEATYTSRGILGAIQNALTGEEVINPAPPQPKPAEPVVMEEFVAPSAYRDGVYTGEAQGFGGPIAVQVTIQSDTITDITILSHDGETTSYFSRARQVIPTMLTANSPEVDSVSGATYSSAGILNAVKSALAKAAADGPAEEAEQPAEEPVEQPAGSQPESEPQPETPEEPATEPEPETPSFWERAKETLSALFPERETASSSAPAVVFRPAESEPASESAEAASAETAPESSAAEAAAETQERPAAPAETPERPETEETAE